MISIRPGFILPAVMGAALFCDGVQALSAPQSAPVSANGSSATQRDGSHDFDFLIGDWKAHVRRLPERLKGSNVWVEYDGISNHKKVLDSTANFEEFDVSSRDKKLRIKAQTLRLYSPESHQWSIYLVDVDKGTLDVPPVVGEFHGGSAASSTTSRSGREERSLCGTSGSTFHPNRHEWSNRFRRTAERRGRLIGSVSSHGKDCQSIHSQWRRRGRRSSERESLR